MAKVEGCKNNYTQEEINEYFGESEEYIKK